MLGVRSARHCGASSIYPLFFPTTQPHSWQETQIHSWAGGASPGGCELFLLGAQQLYFPTSHLMASTTPIVMLLLNVIPAKGCPKISVVDGANLERVLNENIILLIKAFGPALQVAQYWLTRQSFHKLIHLHWLT